jgi:putative peptidoglycan lipid II flippase
MYKEVRGLHQAAYILALFAVGSQLLAIIRDRLLAHIFGAGAELDVYYAAFRIPDLLYVLFASVLSVYVLLPFVSRYTEQINEEAGARVLSQVFSLFLLVFSVVALGLFLAAPLLVPILFPGFVEQTGELVLLMRILLLQVLFLGLSSLCGVVTQMSHRFVLYAISPLLYNGSIIFGIAVLYPFFGLTGLVAGVVIGAIGHLAIQIPFVLQSKYRFKLSGTFDWILLREIFLVSVPRAFTLSINQIVLLILIGMASTMAAGSVSVFQFAFNLQSVPLAIIGMSYSVAAFPTLSTLLAKNDTKEFNLQLLTALRHIIFWSVPVIVLIIVLRAQIVRVVLGTGSFDWADTRLTAAVLAVFVVSLVAQCALLLLIRAFYAGGRAITPLIVSLCTATISIGLAFWFQILYASNPMFESFVRELFRLQDVPGTEILTLALAFVCGQLLQIIVLSIISEQTFGTSYRPLWRLFGQSLVAGLMGGVSAYAALIFVVDGINQNTFIGISLQGLVAGLMGVAAVVLVYRLFNSPELMEIYRSFHARIFKTDVIAPQPDTL